MRQHIRILGILNIIMGALTAMVGVFLLFVMGGVAAYVSQQVRRGYNTDPDAAMAAPVIASIGFALAIFFLVLSLPAILGGWGLMNYKPWSRVLMIVVSVLHLFHIPLGTALGVYGLWVLFSEEARRILESGGTYLGQPAPAYPQPPNYAPQATYTPRPPGA